MYDEKNYNYWGEYFLKTLDTFIEKLYIKENSILLLTENSLTLLMAMKQIGGMSQYNIDELFDILLDKLIKNLGTKALY